MTTIARGETSDCVTPLLEVFTHVLGIATDPFALEFQIWDTSGATLVQVFPSTPGARQAVNLADCPVGDRLGLGHFVARWTVGGAEPAGGHRIKWFVRMTSTDVERVHNEDFDVSLTPLMAGAKGYGLLSEMRAEGITPTLASDARLGVLNDLASRFIDRVTGQWFEPREASYTFDGSDSQELFFRVPIIAISSVQIEGIEVPSSDYVVYNRHLSQGLTQPDDRRNPKITRRHVFRYAFRSEPTRWPRGFQNLTVSGAFGFTDRGSPHCPNAHGIVPPGLRRLCMLLIKRDLAPLASEDHDATVSAGRILSESTRDQSVTFAALGSGSSGRGFAADITGDPEIDGLIALYRAPIALAATRSSAGGGRRRGGWWR
ncbi:MAG: hypothetical protein HOW73_43170 [Polyangiaceae bacterium]|nr:hypothetical protein [Polyangiaceae bacterium]